MGSMPSPYSCQSSSLFRCLLMTGCGLFGELSAGRDNVLVILTLVNLSSLLLYSAGYMC